MLACGAAGRDRRVRARPGSKSRQQGRAELDLDEADDADCVRDLAKEEDLAQEALGPYTHPRQVSPGRHMLGLRNSYARPFAR